MFGLQTPNELVQAHAEKDAAVRRDQSSRVTRLTTFLGSKTFVETPQFRHRPLHDERFDESDRAACCVRSSTTSREMSRVPVHAENVRSHRPRPRKLLEPSRSHLPPTTRVGDPSDKRAARTAPSSVATPEDRAAACDSTNWLRSWHRSMVMAKDS